MEEQSFLSQGGATVTSSRIQIGGKTFATRNVGSVSIATTPAARGAGVAMLLIGLVGFAAHWLFGLIFTALGLVLALSARPTYRLMMMAGGGEAMALESKDGPAVTALHDAVAQAISVR